jgi:hypothetical protein
MTTWLILTAYATGAIITGRKIAFALLEHDDLMQANNVADRAVTRAFGMFLGLFWPAVVLVLTATWRLPKTTTQVRAELAQREAHIADLERKLGIKP